MYAILSQGGHQYRVAPGDRLLVDRLPAEVGTVVALEPVVLLQDDDGIRVGDGVDGARVAATVVAHRRGPKLRIFKYKAKKRYRRTMGHRSDLTELVVEALVARGEALPAATAHLPGRREVAGSAAPAGTGRTAVPATVSVAGEATGEERKPRLRQPKLRQSQEQEREPMEREPKEREPKEREPKEREPRAQEPGAETVSHEAGHSTAEAAQAESKTSGAGSAGTPDADADSGVTKNDDEV